jgi:hypothetical protein
MRFSETIILGIFAAASVGLGCNAILGNDSRGLTPSGSAGHFGSIGSTTDGAPNLAEASSGAPETGPADTATPTNADPTDASVATADGGPDASADAPPPDASASPDADGASCADQSTRSCKDDGALGNCAKGTETCSGGRWGTCSILPAAADTCQDGDDATCNGKLNEGCPCISGKTRSCTADSLVGTCANGTETCDGQGHWGSCSIHPAAADTCASGNNDNCSGAPNEGCLCIEGVTTRPCGTCNDGTQTCSDGKAGNFGACTGGSIQHTYYRDKDGDGHGSASAAVTVCGAALTGYVASNDDCCDSDPLAHPGAAAQQQPRVACGGYDFNCDGVETPADTTVYNASVDCSTGWSPSVPGCGQSADYYYDQFIYNTVTHMSICQGGFSMPSTQSCN